MQKDAVLNNSEYIFLMLGEVLYKYQFDQVW